MNDKQEDCWRINWGGTDSPRATEALKRKNDEIHRVLAAYARDTNMASPSLHALHYEAMRMVWKHRTPAEIVFLLDQVAAAYGGAGSREQVSHAEPTEEPMSAARAESVEHKRLQPPAVAEAVLGFVVPADKSEAILGDAAELYCRNVARRGAGRARLLYWVLVTKALSPLAWRAMLKLLAFAGLLRLS